MAYHLCLTTDERRILCVFLNRLCDESGWLNSKWADEATAHEIAVMYQIRDKVDLTKLSVPAEAQGR